MYTSSLRLLAIGILFRRNKFLSCESKINFGVNILQMQFVLGAWPSARSRPQTARQQSVKNYCVLKRDKQAFILFRYPIAEWYGFFHGAIQVYGHIANEVDTSAYG
jgi:hypothetical protein